MTQVAPVPALINGLAVWGGTETPGPTTSVLDRLAGTEHFPGGLSSLHDALDSFPLFDFTLHTEELRTASGLVVPDSQALVRTTKDGTVSALGAVGSSYTPMPVRDLATLLDPLVHHWPVYAIGMTSSCLFFVLDRGQGRIAGIDPIARYVLFVSPWTSGRALTAAFTGVRMFCQNQIPSILAKTQYRVALPHTKSLPDRTAFEVETMGLLNQATDQLMLALESLTQVPVAHPSAVWRGVWPAPPPPRALPMPAPGPGAADLLLGAQILARREREQQAHSRWESECDKRKRLRTSAAIAYEELNDSQPATGGSAYNALHAVTWVASHHVEPRSDPARAAESAFFPGGERYRWMTSAYQILRGETPESESIIDVESVGAATR